MQSFLTVFLAGCTACLAFMMMTPYSSDEPVRFALEITLEENGERFSAPQMVVEPGKSYRIDLEAGAEYDVAIEIPKNLREVKDPFAGDLEMPDGPFLKLNAELSIEGAEDQKSLSDYGKLIASNFILSLAEPAREMQSIIPVAGRGLLTRAGHPVETLSITIKGTPFTG